MKVVVFGASGKVGRIVVRELLDRGFKVKAVVHTKNPLQPHKNLEIVRGDIYGLSFVQKAVKGSDAVISCLGSWGTKKQNVVSSGMNNIVSAMMKERIQRVVGLTGIAAWSEDQPTIIDKFNHNLLNLIAPKILEDGENLIKVLENGGLDWTVIRSPIMTSSNDSDYKLGLKLAGMTETISRKAVACAIADQIKSSDFINKAPVIHRG